MSVGAPGAEAGRAGRGRATSGLGCWTCSQDQRPPRGCLSGREEPSGRCAGEAVQCSGGGRASAQTRRWPRAGRPSGSLGRPIWQRDAAVVPWPRPPRECAPGRGPASAAPDGGDASGKRPLAGAASDGPPPPRRHLRSRLHAEAGGAEPAGRHPDPAQVHQPAAVLRPGRGHRVRGGPAAGQGPGGPGGVQHRPGAAGRQMR